MPWHGMAWHGMAWHSLTKFLCHGMALLNKISMPWHGMAWHSLTKFLCHGMPCHTMPCHGWLAAVLLYLVLKVLIVGFMLKVLIECSMSVCILLIIWLYVNGLVSYLLCYPIQNRCKHLFIFVFICQ